MRHCIRTSRLHLAIVPLVFALVACNRTGRTNEREGAPTKDPRITWENFDRIKHGMTQEEVDSILGPGKDVPTSGTSGLAGERHRGYGDIRISQWIGVGFTNGRVVGKSGVLTNEDGRIFGKEG